MQKIARDPYRFTHHEDGTPTTLAERLNFAPPLRAQRVNRWQTSSLKRRRRREQAELPQMLPKGVERDSAFRQRHGIGVESEGLLGNVRRRIARAGRQILRGLRPGAK